MLARAYRAMAARDGLPARRLTEAPRSLYVPTRMTIDEALLALNDRLGQEVTAWVEIDHEKPLLIATGVLDNWSRETLAEMLPKDEPQHFDLRGHYSIGDARFDLSDAPVESVGEHVGRNGLVFRLAGGARLVVTWLPMPEQDLV
jgi:hypothetical protein